MGGRTGKERRWEEGREGGGKRERVKGMGERKGKGRMNMEKEKTGVGIRRGREKGYRGKEKEQVRGGGMRKMRIWVERREG